MRVFGAFVAFAALGCSAARADRRDFVFELEVEAVTSLDRDAGAILVADTDPRFVLAGFVRWRQPTGPWPLGSKIELAVHSPARLFGGATPTRGDRACLHVERDAARWHLRPEPRDRCAGPVRP